MTIFTPARQRTLEEIQERNRRMKSKENMKNVAGAETCSVISMYVINLILHMLLKKEEKKVEH
jgi:hypothetical protein